MLNSRPIHKDRDARWVDPKCLIPYKLAVRCWWRRRPSRALEYRRWVPTLAGESLGYGQCLLPLLDPICLRASREGDGEMRPGMYTPCTRSRRLKYLETGSDRPHPWAAARDDLGTGCRPTAPVQKRCKGTAEVPPGRHRLSLSPVSSCASRICSSRSKWSFRSARCPGSPPSDRRRHNEAPRRSARMLPRHSERTSERTSMGTSEGDGPISGISAWIPIPEPGLRSGLGAVSGVLAPGRPARA